VETTTRHIENRLSKERITFVRTGAETDGELFAFEVWVPADMVSPPPHLHLAEEERLEVLEGEMTVQTDGRQHVLRPGESHVLKPGVAHTWWNSGPKPLRFRGEFSPAGHMQSFFETYCGLAAEGRSDEKGQPPLLQVAASLPLWGMYQAGPPILAQRLLVAVLRPVARLRGYHPRYERFEQSVHNTS
jgi:quercetin dioxygenase-like cupin family protein